MLGERQNKAVAVGKVQSEAATAVGQQQWVAGDAAAAMGEAAVVIAKKGRSSEVKNGMARAGGQRKQRGVAKATDWQQHAASEGTAEG